MYISIPEFLDDWRMESGTTRAVLATLTEESLSTAITPHDRTLGRLAWHLATTIPHIMHCVGLPAADLREDTPMPATLDEIRRTYDEASAALAREVEANWTDETLRVEDQVFTYTWKRGFTLTLIIHHEIHHRGQMTVLMRQAGLRPPPLYGPVREDWATWGMPAPAV